MSRNSTIFPPRASRQSPPAAPGGNPAAGGGKAIARAILGWWADARRDLPWRRRRDPYAVWVSEVMLQQTRVATVLEYYEPFLRRFPTVHALAAATLADVLKAWQGLGYYSRARNLRAAARVLVAEHGGRLPRTAEQLRRLPGIGVYTAAAIASIAFGEVAAVVDGNVARVLCRLLAVGGDPRRPAVARRLHAAADALLSVCSTAVRRVVSRRSRGEIPTHACPVGGGTTNEETPLAFSREEEGASPGDFNQAMMDLGAMICTPARPNCAACPLRRRCRAAAAGRQADLPHKTPRRAVPHYDVAVAVIRSRGRLLLDRRPDDAMLGGLWELPGGKGDAGETLEQAVVREVREEVGLDVEVLSSPVNTRGARTTREVKQSPSTSSIATVDHAYSHFRVTLHAFECRRRSGRARAIGCAAVRWVPFAKLSEYAIPAATLKILREIGALDRKRG